MDAFSDLTVIMPTINEAGNVGKLIGLLAKRYKGVSIIISDDGSTDGTKEIVQSAARANGRIRFLDRSKREVHGLAASVMDAAMITDTRKIIVMDADLQHPYERIGDMAKALDSSDLVIGVRGRIRNWGVQRRIISFSISSFAYVVFKLRGRPTCNDMMSGLFGIRTSLFKSLIMRNRDSFVGKGYKILLDILRVIGNDATIAEVSYDTFHERKYGKSKLSNFGINHASDTLQSILR